MQFGLALPNFGEYADPGIIKDFAIKAEQSGFDSLWVSEHIVIPESHNVFGDVFYEPLTTLSYVSSFTEKITLGTSIIVLPYRNPVVLAKTLSTLDILSEGRVIIGVGTGWLDEEFKALNANYNERGQITDEYLEILKVLFTEDKAEYNGTYHSFSKIKFFPKPIQAPHPPIWIGGNSDKALERTVRFGDGWHAVGLTPGEMRARCYHLAVLNESGKEIAVSVRKNLQLTDREVRDKSEILRGSREKITEGIDNYRGSGVDQLIFQLLSGSLEGIFEAMEFISEEIL